MNFNKCVLVLAMFLVTIVAAGCSGTSDNQNSVSSSETPTTVQTQNVGSSYRIYKIGETASDDKTKITVDGIRYADSVNEKNDEYYIAHAEDGFKYLILNLTLENISPDRSRTYAFMQYKILSPDGSTYNLDDNSTMALSNQIDVAYVAPGSTRRGELAFKVPENSTDLQFQFIYDPLGSADSVVYSV